MKSSGLTRLVARVGSLAAALCLFTGLYAQNFTAYDLIVPEAAVLDAVTVVDGAGVTLPANRSFVIGIEGGLRNRIKFVNWNGTANFPIVITNRHGTGRVSITDGEPATPNYPRRTGIEIVDSKFVQLRGDNDPAHRYGIEIARAGGKGGPGGHRGIDVFGKSSDVEISFLEIQQIGFCGIMVKQDPSCEADTSHPLLVYRNISVHDNYIHDIGAEALYIGFSFWTEDRCTTGEGGWAHNIEGLRIYNNLIERCSWDGIQIGAAPVDVEVYNNTIIDIGAPGSDASGDGGTGIQIGGGTTGRFHSNIIINCRNGGITLFGIGNNIVYNNLVYGCGGGMFIDNRPDKDDLTGQPADRQTQPGSPYYIYNNTFMNIASHVLWTMSASTDNHFMNNLAVAPNPDANFIRYESPRPTHPVPTGLEDGNVFQRDMTGLNFADPSNYDFRLLNSSTNGVDDGVSLPNYVTLDFLGVPRPQNSVYDAGYAESGTLSVYLVAHPPTNAGNDGMLIASAINGTAPYTYTWSTGATTATISDLAPGLYSVTVTDAASRVVKKATYLFTGAEMGMPVGLTPPTQVETPTFTPPSGTYATATSVTIATATSGATIRYTTDGSTPTATHGTVYSSPVSVSSHGTLKAIAYKSGLTNSTVAVATYFIGAPPAAPVLTANLAGDRRIELSWTVVANADRYKLKSATAQSGPYSTLGTFTTTSFTHQGVLNGTTYYYLVEAENFLGVGPESNLAIATPFPYSGPVGILSGFSAGPTTVQSVSAAGALNEPPSWNATTGQPEGDAAAPHTSTSTSTANRFWAIDFGVDFAKYHITETWTRYRPNSPGNKPGFASFWWDNDKDVALDDGEVETSLNFQTAQNMPNVGQRWIRDRDLRLDPLEPKRQYLVIGTGSSTTDRPNEFALIGWLDGSPASPVFSHQPQSLNVPIGTSVILSVGVTASPEPTYQWRKNGVNIAGETGPALKFTSVQPTNAGNYSIVVTNASGSVTSANATLTVVTPALTILAPFAVGTATGSAPCHAAGAFNEQPSWDDAAGKPSGFAAAPHSSTNTAYANRYWFIDLGENYQKWRITQMWTRYRPFSGGNHPGFAMLWWDDDIDNVVEGPAAGDMNFNTAQSLPHVGDQRWERDRDFTATPITPEKRYLVVSVGPSPTDRPNEFAFVGYQLP